MSDATLEDGMTVRRQVLGDAHVDRATASKTEFTAEFQEFITRYAWGAIWTRPGLDRRTRSCITVAMLAALGLLALKGAPPSRHGTASGIFFAFFDIGVGLGGPAAGAAALLAGTPSGALLTAAAAVAVTGLIPVVATARQRARQASPLRGSF